MFKFILFAIIIFVALSAFSIFRFVLKILFGKPFSSARGYANQKRQESSYADDSNAHQPNQKVFSKDEGEYVDYEEIKD